VSALFLAPVLLQLHNAGIRQRILPLIAPQPVEAPGTHWNGLALRPAEAEVVTTLRSAALAHGFHDGGDVISLYDMPWLVDAIGGVSPGVPWYYGAFPGSVASAAYVLGTLPRDRLRKACFLTRSKATHELPDLHALGVPFPEEYDLLASVTWPRTGDVVRLWAPSAR
jgi:hypothetical protein